MVAAFPTDSALHGGLAHSTMFWFALWAVFAVWVTLDASALLGLVGPRPDPLGPKALRSSALGIANIASMCLLVIMTRGQEVRTRTASSGWLALLQGARSRPGRRISWSLLAKEATP